MIVDVILALISPEDVMFLREAWPSKLNAPFTVPLLTNTNWWLKPVIDPPLPLYAYPSPKWLPKLSLAVDIWYTVPLEDCPIPQTPCTSPPPSA